MQLNKEIKLVEKWQRYNLTHSKKDKKVNTCSESISSELNLIG